jgi:hypothetical protein
MSLKHNLLKTHVVRNGLFQMDFFGLDGAPEEHKL